VLTPGQPAAYELADGPKALAELETRATVGKLALLPRADREHPRLQDREGAGHGDGAERVVARACAVTPLPRPE
jgi:hypothetical protein